MVQWLEGYVHDPEPGAGHSPVAGNRKVILHTTETGPGSFNAVRNSWRGSQNWGKGLPHFLMEGRRIEQLLPLDTCAYTSKNGGIDANKAGTPIQIEIVHYAADPFNDVEYDVIGKWLADMMEQGIDLDLNQCPPFYGPNDGIVLATPDSPVRDIIANQWGSYANWNGIGGHQHLEGNDHWDPGDLDIERVCNIVKNYLDLDGSAQEDEMADSRRLYFTNTKDSKWVVEVFGANPGEQHVFRHNLVTRDVRHCGPAELEKAMIWKHDPTIVWQGGVPGVAGELDDSYIDGMTLVPHAKYA